MSHPATRNGPVPNSTPNGDTPSVGEKDEPAYSLDRWEKYWRSGDVAWHSGEVHP